MLRETFPLECWVCTCTCHIILSPNFCAHPCFFLTGIYFNTTHLRMLDEIEKAVTVIGYGLELFHADKSKGHINLSPKLSCSSNESRWKDGDLFFQLVFSNSPVSTHSSWDFLLPNRYLRNVSIKQTKYQNKPDIEFNPDGTLKFVELDIVNLNHMGNWEKVIVCHQKDLVTTYWFTDWCVDWRRVEHKGYYMAGELTSTSRRSSRKV